MPKWGDGAKQTVELENKEVTRQRKLAVAVNLKSRNIKANPPFTGKLSYLPNSLIKKVRITKYLIATETLLATVFPGRTIQ